MAYWRLRKTGRRTERYGVTGQSSQPGCVLQKPDPAGKRRCCRNARQCFHGCRNTALRVPCRAGRVLDFIQAARGVGGAKAHFRAVRRSRAGGIVSGGSGLVAEGPSAGTSTVVVVAGGALIVHGGRKGVITDFLIFPSVGGRGKKKGSKEGQKPFLLSERITWRTNRQKGF